MTRLGTWLLSFACCTSLLFVRATQDACPQFPTCPDSSSDGLPFTRRFLVEHANTETDFCQSLSAQLFVEAYNTLSRLHCDVPCFRTAVDATVLACGNGKVPLTLSLDALDEARTAVIEVHFVQSAACFNNTKALDVSRDFTVTPIIIEDEDVFVDICGYSPRQGWSYGQFDYDYKGNQKSKNNDHNTSPSGPCCCLCDKSHPLAENDLLYLFKLYHLQKDAPWSYVTMNELDSREDCDGKQLALDRILLAEYTGRDPVVDGTIIASLDSVLREVYNGQSFDRCDTSGRQIATSQTKLVQRSSENQKRELQSSPFGFVNAYPQYKCRSPVCTETVVQGRAKCTATTCPEPNDLRLLGTTVSGRRLLHDEMPWPTTMTRHLYDTSIADLIYQDCSCRTHAEKPGTLFNASDWIAQFNKEIMGRNEFLLSQLGAIAQLTEYVAVPTTGGEVVERSFSILAYVHGSICKKVVYTDKKGNHLEEYEVDEDMVYDLVEIIRRSYNDMAAEDCDKPLFRQFVSAYLTDVDFFKNGHFDCFQPEFVLDISLVLQCHGHCQSPFDDSRRERRDLESRKEKRNGPDSVAVQDKTFPVPTAKASRLHDYSSRRISYSEQQSYGLCAVESVGNPKSPTLSGWEQRVNKYKPLVVNLVDILWDQGPLCRCEDGDDSLYYLDTPSQYSPYHTINGVHIVPKAMCPDDGTFQNFTDIVYFC